jgi:hypothetical protein
MLIHRLVAVVAMTLLIVLSLLPEYATISEAKSSVVKLNWKVFSNITNMNSFAYSVCETGNYIYVIEELENETQALYYPRVEMRAKQDGSLVKEFNSNLQSYKEPYNRRLYDCVIAEDKLYIAGSWFDWIMFDLNLNLLDYVHRGLTGYVSSIIYYDGHLYRVGFVYVDNKNSVWKIEKWSAKYGTLVKEYTSDPTPVVDYAYSAGINPVTKQLWVVGNANLFGEGGSRARIEILDLDLNRVKVIERYEDKATAVAFDEEGYAYISGTFALNGFIAKYDKYGKEVAIIKRALMYQQLLYANGFLYAAASQYRENANFAHTLNVFDRNLNLIEEIRLSEDDMYALLTTGKMAFDGRNLFVAGGGFISDVSKGYVSNRMGVIYSLAITEITTTTTVTSPTITSPITSPTTPIQTTPTITSPPISPTTTPRITTSPLIVIPFSIELIIIIIAVIVAVIVATLYIITRKRKAPVISPPPV